MNRPVHSAPNAADYLLLITLAAIFGASFLFTHIGVSDIPPLTIAAARVLIATIILFPIMHVSGQKLPPLGHIWLPILAAAVTGYALPFTLVSWGQINVSASLASIFMAIMPLVTLVLAHAFTDDEKLNNWKVCGVFCGLAGVIVLFGLEALVNIGGSNSLAQLAILAAAVCYAINALVTRSLVDVPKLSMLVALLLTSSLLAVPISLIFEHPWELSPSWPAVAALIVLAIGPTAIATLMLLIIVSRQGASFLSQINFLVPLFGVMFGWLFLDERLSANAWVALALIMIGVGLSRRGNARK